MTSPQYLGPIFQHGKVAPDAEKAARDWAERMGDYATPRGIFEGEIPHVSIDFD